MRCKNYQMNRKHLQKAISPKKKQKKHLLISHLSKNLLILRIQMKVLKILKFLYTQIIILLIYVEDPMCRTQVLLSILNLLDWVVLTGGETNPRNNYKEYMVQAGFLRVI